MAVQGLVFAVWAALAFRTLFRLRARAVARSGRAFPGLRPTLATFGDFWHAPEHAADRKAMGWSSALLAVVMVVNLGGNL